MQRRNVKHIDNLFHLSSCFFSVNVLKSTKRLNNITATKALKEIYSNKDINPKDYDQLIQDAFKIYHKINEPINNFVINSLLKLCLSFNCSEKIFLIWNDIDKTDGISYLLLMKCCIASKDIDKSIKVLQWIKLKNYSLKNEFELKEYRSNISKLLGLLDIHQTTKLQSIYLLLQNDDDIFIKTSLINAFGNCSDIICAEQIFNSIPFKQKDAVIINTMIKMYINNGLNNDALSIYNEYNMIINNLSHRLALKACINANDLKNGILIHQHIGTVNDCKLLAALIEFYGHFGDIQNALKLFNSNDVIQSNNLCINALIKLYIKNDCNMDAIWVYDKYYKFTDNISHVLAIKACINTDNVDKGKQIHQLINGNKDIYIKTALIDLYGYSGDIHTAFNVFNSIPDKDKNIVTINAMMTAYIDNNLNEEALTLYDIYCSMLNDRSHVLGIKAASNLKNVEKGKEIHVNPQVINSKNIQIQNTLIDFYGNIGDIENAEKIYVMIDKLNRNEVTYTTMMNCYFMNGIYENVFSIYNEIDSTKRTNISDMIGIKTCIKMNDFQSGKEIHKIIVSKAIDPDLPLKITLIDFYGHFSDIMNAENIFNLISDDEKTTLCINCMMKTYVNNDCYWKALDLYNKYESFTNDMTHNLAIKACINSNNYEEGQRIHCLIDPFGDIGKKKYHSIEFKNTLIHFYCHFGDIDKGINIFNCINDKDKTISTINIMMAGYCNNSNRSYYEECIQLFKNMDTSFNHLIPDILTYTLIIKACTQTTKLYLGRKIHNDLKNNINNQWMLYETDIEVNLINMYGKCGIINLCEQIFNDIKKKHYDKYCTEIRIWNAMINAYGRNGKLDAAKDIFYNILNMESLIENVATYINILNACNHCGNLEEARNIWEYQIKNDEIKYNKNIITIMVDCYARKGFVNEGKEIISKYYNYHNQQQNHCNYHNEQDITIWMVLLSGCRKYENKQFGIQIYNEMKLRFNLNSHHMTSASILMSNILKS